MLEPRLDPDEIKYLKDFMSALPPDSKMVEWGSGGSTTMLIPYFKTGKLISIEHNREWFDKVQKELESDEYPAECLKNFTYAYIPPKVDIRFYGYGIPFEENPCFAKDYINPVIPDEYVWDADVFFVDGICRGPILATIMKKAINRGRQFDLTNDKWIEPATVFIHDYYGPEKREVWYDWASGLFSKVERVGNTLARLYL